MKIALVSTALVSLASLSANAHGSLAHQASEAVESAVTLFQATQPRDVARQFQSLSATLAGHEQFQVVLSLKNGAVLTYACHENEDVEPVVWECAAQ